MFRMVKSGTMVVLAMSLIIAFSIVALHAGQLLKAGELLPENLMIETADGSKVSFLKAAKGKDSIVIFMTTVCNRCLQEIKWVLENYPKERILLVSVDMGGTPAVKRWRKMHLSAYSPEDMTVFMDPNFEVAADFGFSFTPASVLIDKDGRVLERIPGYDESSRAKIKAHFE